MLKISTILPFKKSYQSWLEQLLDELRIFIRSKGLFLIEHLGEWKLQASDASEVLTQQELEVITQKLEELNQEVKWKQESQKQHDFDQRELNPPAWED